jgi:hypothetical protein
MSKSSKNKQGEVLSFQLKGIELLHSSLIHPNKDISEINLFNFDIKIEHKVNFEKKILFVICSIEISDNERDQKFGSISVNCLFGIDNLGEFIEPKTKMIKLPDQIAIMLNSITISTTRGVMFSQFKGTFLHHAYLPVIDPKSFIPQVE